MKREISIAAVFVSLALAACSGADEHPLGGPYGGAAGSLSGPNAGSSGSGPAGSNGDAPSGAGSTDDPNADPGDPATGSSDGGVHKPASDGGSPSPSPSNPTSPTWGSIYAAYLAPGTIGDCGGGSCHSGMRTAAGAYGYLKRKGYISGTSSALVDPNQSCLSWLGGSMPPSGPSSNAKATADMNAWAKAGALQN